MKYKFKQVNMKAVKFENNEESVRSALKFTMPPHLVSQAMVDHILKLKYFIIPITKGYGYNIVKFGDYITKDITNSVYVIYTNSDFKNLFDHVDGNTYITKYKKANIIKLDGTDDSIKEAVCFIMQAKLGTDMMNEILKNIRRAGFYVKIEVNFGDYIVKDGRGFYTIDEATLNEMYEKIDTSINKEG